MPPSHYPKTNQPQFSIMWTNEGFPLLGLAKSVGEVSCLFFLPHHHCVNYTNHLKHLFKKNELKREEELITDRHTEHVSCLLHVFRVFWLFFMCRFWCQIDFHSKFFIFHFILFIFIFTCLSLCLTSPSTRACICVVSSAPQVNLTSVSPPKHPWLVTLIWI